MLKAAALVLLLGVAVTGAQTVTITSAYRAAGAEVTLGSQDGDNNGSNFDTSTDPFTLSRVTTAVDMDDNSAGAGASQDTSFTFSPGSVVFTGSFNAGGTISIVTDPAPTATTTAGSSLDLKFTVDSDGTFSSNLALSGTGYYDYELIDQTADYFDTSIYPGMSSVQLFAGHTYELLFSVGADLSGSTSNTINESADLTFGITAIPEPSTWALLLTGAAVIANRKLRRRS